MKYGFGTTVDLSFDDAVAKVTDLLKDEGFGVLTTIDVRDTLKKKLDVDFRRYTILGACNPGFAHQALQAEEEVGLLLPCNVIVYEKDKGTGVAAFDPSVMTTIIGNPGLVPIVSSVKERLERVIHSMKSNEERKEHA